MFIRATTFWTGSTRQILGRPIYNSLLTEVIRTRPLFFHTSSTPIADMDKVNTTSRLSKLRALMKERNIDVYGEYLTQRLYPVFACKC